MNIYRFELKRMLVSGVLWTLGLLFALCMFMFGVYPVFTGALDDVYKMLSAFPPAFAEAFGMDVHNMFTSYGGFYGFGFTYISLMGAIYAATLSISAFSREKRSKCLDFILSKPISRSTIFTAKLCAGLTLLLMSNVTFIIASMIIGAQNSATGFSMFLASLSLLLTQLVFYAAGVCYAIFAKRVRSVSGAATTFGFVGFMLSALNNIVAEDFMRFIAPLKYFDPTYAFINAGYQWPYALTGAVIAIVCICLAYRRFTQSDARAV